MALPSLIQDGGDLHCLPDYVLHVQYKARCDKLKTTFNLATFQITKAIRPTRYIYGLQQYVTYRLHVKLSQGSIGAFHINYTK